MAMRVRRSPADDVLLRALRLAMAISVRAADRLGNVSPVQLRALTVVAENSGANLIQLAERMGVTVSTTSRLVSRLVSAGLVDRRAASHNRREISLALTTAGSALLERYDALRSAELGACLARVAVQQQESVVSAIAQLVEVGLPEAVTALVTWSGEPAGTAGQKATGSSSTP
jgi:DNA-binding MarR family transcriptional regulator